MRGLWEEEAFGNLKLRRENEEEEEEIEVETYWSEEWEAQMREAILLGSSHTDTVMCCVLLCALRVRTRTCNFFFHFFQFF